MKLAACVLVRNKDNPALFLGVSRKNNKNDYGLPGGKVEDKELLDDAAIRECCEESGIVVSDLVLVFADYVPGEVDYLCVVFIAGNYTGTIKQQDNEGVAGWVDKETLLKGSFGGFNRKLFNELGI